MPEFSGIVETPAAMRLDRYISEKLGLLSRSQIKVRGLKAVLNGRAVKVSRDVRTGDRLECTWNEAVEPNLEPEDIPLNIIYEDDSVVVVNKEQGMVTHPGAGCHSGTLANALLYRRLSRTAKRSSAESGEETRLEAGQENVGGAGMRTGIVHRLDKDTSGVIIASYNDTALACLSGQFKERKARKTYIAVVMGCPPEKAGIIETRLTRDARSRKRFTVSLTDGKKALTRYRLLRSWESHSLVLLMPRTGRTHQLRVQMKYLKCPILGDPVYAPRDSLFPDASLMLHALSLSIALPPDGRLARFKADVPERFKKIIRDLKAR